MNRELQDQVSSLSCEKYSNNEIVATLINGTISIVSSNELQIIKNIKVNEATPLSASFSSSNFGPLLAVGCSDGVIRLYRNYSEICKLEKQNGSILSVSFHPTKCMIASACLNGTFSVHKMNDNQTSWISSTIIASRMGLTAINWGSDLSDAYCLIVGGADGVIRIFKLINNVWEQVCAKQIFNGWIRTISVPKTSQSIVQKIVVCSEDSSSVVVIRVINNEMSIRKIKSLSVPVSGATWGMIDQIIILNHINNIISIWREDKKGKWFLTKSYKS